MKSANLRELVTQNVPTATSLRNIKKFVLLPPDYLGSFHHSQLYCGPPWLQNFCCSAWTSAHPVMWTWRLPESPKTVFSDSTNRWWIGSWSVIHTGWTGRCSFLSYSLTLPLCTTSHGTTWPNTLSHTQRKKTWKALCDNLSTLHRS